MCSYIISPPPGTLDIFDDEMNRRRMIKNVIDNTLPLYGYKEIETPIIEYSEVFKRNIGYQNDVVNKEMYIFKDKGGRELALRPEATAGTIRALIKANFLDDPKMNHVYYYGPMFRSDRPAAGRRKQFNQVGVENVCDPNPFQDAECIIMLTHLLNNLQITNGTLLINTKGSDKDMMVTVEAMKKFFSNYIGEMCSDCKDRLQNNVLRILDCKVKRCKTIIEQSPKIIDLICNKSQKYFNEVINILDNNKIKYNISHQLIRGLDYYKHTIFEVQHDISGKIDAITGGGRYIISMKGLEKNINGVGFASGIERFILAQDSCKVQINNKQQKLVYIITPPNCSEETKKNNFILMQTLRKNNIFVTMNFDDTKSTKSQMRLANRCNASHIMIIGDNERKSKIIGIKDMATGEQKNIDQVEIVDYIKNKLILS